jgi:hypothetical protein
MAEKRIDIRWNEPTGCGGEKNLERGNDAVFTTHLNVKMIPVTSRLERRSVR